MNTPKEIVVLGGGGFIGSHLTKRLLDSTDNHYIVVDRDRSKLQALLDRSMNHPRLTFHERDVRGMSDRDLDELVKDADLVIDLIAHANPSQYIEMPLEVVELNFFENLRFVEVCAKHDVRLIQFSTCEVYGMTQHEDQQFSEDSTNFLVGPVRNHRWIYSCAKQLLERIIHAHGMENGLNYTIIRPFNFIGPYMDYLVDEKVMGGPRVFPQFMSSLIYGHPITLVDGGRNYRTFTYIDDAVDALKRVVDNAGGQFDREIVNIGSPDNETSIRDLAYRMIDIYEEITGRKAECEVTETPSDTFYGEGYQDCDRRIPDIEKLRNAGWSPKYDLHDTLAESIRFYLRENRRLTA